MFYDVLLLTNISSGRFPNGLEDVSKYPALIQELLQRNWSEAEVAGVLRLNFLRVFEQVEKVSSVHRDESKTRSNKTNKGTAVPL